MRIALINGWGGLVNRFGLDRYTGCGGFRGTFAAFCHASHCFSRSPALCGCLGAPMNDTREADGHNMTMYYLAYGSNLHPTRLGQRAPSARFVGVAQLGGCRLAFEKRGMDRSAKCNLDVSGNASHIAYGAVYELSRSEIYLLDRAEGLGKGYDKEYMQIRLGSDSVDVFVYLASASHVTPELWPYDWYKGLVLAGARKHRFPAEYIERIARVPSKPDLDKARRLEMEKLLIALDE